MHVFEQKLLDNWATEHWGDLTILLAVSGGGDSIALLRAILAIRKLLGQAPLGQVIVAHFNHRLRGAESDADEQLVVSLCRELGVECVVGTVDPQSRLQQEGNQGEGLESLARQARYDFLEKTAAQVGARYLVTAHTYDDQVETVLHRILRGTGLRGLGGIARVRRLNESLSLLRPMLEVTRKDVLTYLADLGQPFREDASNQDRSFTRNRLRHDLLPVLQRDYNPASSEALARLARLARENLEFLDRILDQLAITAIKEVGRNMVVLYRKPLCEELSYLVRELMVRLWSEQGWPQQAMGYDQWDRLAGLIQGKPSVDDEQPVEAMSAAQVTLPGGITVEVQHETVTLRRV